MPEAPDPSNADAAEPRPPQIDVEKLADRVYQLLLADARLGRARGDSPPVSSRMGEA